MFGYFLSKNICIIIAYMLPAYITWKSLKRSPLMTFNPYAPGGSGMTAAEFHRELEAQRRLLHYWIVVGLFAIVEFYLDVLIFSVPFYYELKIFFFCYLSYYKGAQVLWDEIIEPHLVTNEAHIDTNIKKAREKVFSKVVQFSNYGLGFTQRMVLNGWLEGQRASVVRERSQMVADDDEYHEDYLSGSDYSEGEGGDVTGSHSVAEDESTHALPEELIAS
ncbi:receptor expression-enhancing protein 2-like [Planoprotostelium fungivorum]|uniref:Receptor expression-enhancing protein 2-like n=1 Tax=Planoprotostelium fungivorum TaxID=1890364 RepID=A0A2P6NBR7_9EUKA|nr:receptor expression-enhancing protein 2-like [Planoprotostelium fungivorum]